MPVVSEFSISSVERGLQQAKPPLRFETGGRLGEVLERRSVKGDNLDLLTQRTEVQAFELPEAFVYRVNFPNTPIYTQRLIDLLHQATPYALDKEDVPFTAGAIRADWEIEKLANGAELAAMHSGAIKIKWEQFMAGDRHTFLAALLMHDEKAIHRVLNSGAAYKATPAAVEAKKQAERSHARTIKYTLNNSTKYNAPYEIGFDALSTEMQDFILARSDLGYFGKVIQSDEIGPLDTSGYSSYGREQYIEHLGNGVLKVSSEDSWATYDINQIPAVERERHIVVDESQMMIPSLVWARSKSEEKRVYLDNIELPDFLQPADPRSNLRLGFVLATALSERVRGKLPREIGLPGSDIKQEMHEPQVPLLVYMFDRMLLEGRFFSDIERKSELVSITPEYVKEARAVQATVNRGVTQVTRRIRRWIAA
jgi:hypothetical protein